MAQTQKTTQVVFSGVNPWQPTHLMKDDEVQTATNIDFSLMNGALVPRRGGFKNNSVGTAIITDLFHNFNGAAINSGPMYVTDTSSKLYRIDAPNTPNSGVTTIATDVTGSEPFPPAMTSYKNYTIVAGGTGLWKDDGTNTTEWIKQVPTAPTVTVNTLTGLTLTGTYTVPDGQFIDTTSNTCTFATDDSNTASCQFVFTTASDLTVNGTHSLGNFATHFVNIAFSDPEQVTKISWDYSVNDGSFTDFFHYELNPQRGGVIITKNNSQALVNSQLSVGTNTASAITSQQRLDIWSNLAQYDFNPLSFTPSVADSLTPWAVTVPQFQFVGQNAVGTSGADLAKSVYALRISVVTTGTCTVTMADPQVYGCEDFPLTDVNSGYYYWQTFATTNTDGLKIDEGAPSPPTGPILMQNAQAKVVQTGTATGTKHGINAIITYRQGGYMQDAYAINTTSYGTALGTITDTMNDIDALSDNFAMPRGLMSKSQVPGSISSISEAVQDRVFFADGNLIRWTLPGQIGAIPLDSFQEVSSEGDSIQGILAWNPGLVIINRSSVYEMYGTDFEAGQYTLTRTGCRRGSLAQKTVIRTPYGIPLLNVDGLTMYVPGYNNEQDITWFSDVYGDVFKGGDINDPAYLKGQRVPALNRGSVHTSCAAYRNHKLYLAIPTGPTSDGALPDTVFVLDFNLKKAWWYKYPYTITALISDERLGYLWAATSDGSLMTIEVTTTDQTSAGATTPIVWTARTKQWTNDSTTVLENLAIDSEGASIVVKAYYDNTTNPSVATLTNTVRDWSIPPLNGTFVNGVAFDFNGTSAGTSTTTGSLAAVYGMSFDQLSEPYEVRYFRTEYDEHNWAADKLWDVAYYDIDIVGTGTVSAVTFVDTTAVMTYTFTGPTGGRQVFETAFPPEIYGRVAYTTYTSTATNVFLKPWFTRYDARNEPAKINYWRTDIESLEENICEAFDVDINPNGTVFGTIYIDNVATHTATITGTNRQSFTYDIPTATYPNNTYGRTIYVAYTGTAFKHYKTWFHLKLEPDRWTEYITPKQTGDEREVKVFKPEINPLGNIVTATTFLDGIAISTYTITGSVRKQYTLSMPVEKYGRTLHAAYQVVSTNSARFKHYTTEFEGPVEPPRVTLFRTGPYPYDSDHWLKTWQPLLDPLSGTVTGVLTVDDIAIMTSTFTGNRRQWFTVGIDLDTTNDYILTTGSRWEAVYSCNTGQFKHYETKMDSDVDPLRKVSWSFHYRKIGGATQIDLARYWSMFSGVKDTRNDGPAVATYWWDIDGENFSTGTLTVGSGHLFTDRIPFPPGARGRLFEFRIYAPGTIKIQNVNIDLMEEGVKGLTRRGHQGTPQESNN